MRTIKIGKKKCVTIAGLASLMMLSACGNPKDAQLETEKLLNQKRIDILKKGNDSLTQPRDVIFWSKFKTAADIPCFETWLATHQYTLSYKTQRPDDAYPEFVEFSKAMIPTLDTMNTVTEDVMTATTACKGQYQEWEAPVVP